MVDKEILGNNIKKLREEAGLSQAQLAECLAVDQSLISKFESGERSVSTVQLDKIANLFCYPVRLIVAGPITSDKLHCISFRAGKLSAEDILALSDINRIFLNQIEMNNYGKNHDRQI